MSTSKYHPTIHPFTHVHYSKERTVNLVAVVVDTRTDERIGRVTAPTMEALVLEAKRLARECRVPVQHVGIKVIPQK